MARIFYRSSLFLYEVEDYGKGRTPIIVFWRGTVYTFWHPADKETMREVLEDYTGAELVEPRRYEAWEAVQVPASESRGLGFNWLEVSQGLKRGPHVDPEERIAVFFLPAWKKAGLRLGYSGWMARISAYGAVKRAGKAAGRTVVKFWEWLTR